MSLFRHHEWRYYGFGLRAGLANVMGNGLQLGLKKTIGKISQPINAPSRFAEYDAFDRAIRDHLRGAGRADTPRILDVGSPKLIGLYLARTLDADLLLTDITRVNIDEYRIMWRALEKRARGRVEFTLQDARSLGLPSNAFDVVYSMSVVEHVEGEGGDSEALREMVRVLKPGGLLVVSVPFGRTYMEQARVGFAGASTKTGDEREYFFQRIFDRRAFQTRILDALGDLERVGVTTVTRRNLWLAGAYGKTGENVRGLLGFLNPLISTTTSQTRAGVDDNFPVAYGRMHRAADVYGDVILSGTKRLSRPAHG